MAKLICGSGKCGKPIERGQGLTAVRMNSGKPCYVHCESLPGFERSCRDQFYLDEEQKLLSSKKEKAAGSAAGDD